MHGKRLSKKETDNICLRYDADAPANTVKELVKKGICPIDILKNLDANDLLPHKIGTQKGILGYDIIIKANKSISYNANYNYEQSDVIDSILIIKENDTKLNNKTIASRLATIVKKCIFKTPGDYCHDDLDKGLTAISEILKRTNNAISKRSFEVIIIEKDAYDKLAYKDFAHVITTSEIDKKFNKTKKKTAKKIAEKKQLYLSSRGLFFGNTAEVEIRSNIQSICKTIDWVAKSGEKVILLPINTRHEIASKGDKIMAASLISMTLHRRIAYTKSEEMYKELIASCPNIEEVSDDELEKRLLENIKTVYPVHKSLFFRCVSQKLSCNEVTVMADDEKGFAQVNVKNIIDPAGK
ncbi:hypothetical protein, partial [Mogibacterium diversum]|uniref:hypothetical protein n=1 Tax=Mogibacterium diversum TaxID=114527 RepID=UPI0028D232AE